MSEHVWVSLRPAATTLSDLYTVPVGKRLTGRVVCTPTDLDTTVRVSVALAGAADALSQYTLRDTPVVEGLPISTAPLSLPAGAVIRVWSADGAVNFHLTGLLL